MILRPQIFILTVAFWLCSCTQHATRPSADVTFQGRDLLYKGKKFTGTLTQAFPQVGTERRSEYRDGKKHGIEEEVTKTGSVVAKRNYQSGAKHGPQKGWFRDGKRQFHKEYFHGQLHGESWSWYNSGALASYRLYENGRLMGEKVWRKSGQIYANYVFPEGKKSAGSPGTKLCFQTRNEKTAKERKQSQAIK